MIEKIWDNCILVPSSCRKLQKWMHVLKNNKNVPSSWPKLHFATLVPSIFLIIPKLPLPQIVDNLIIHIFLFPNTSFFVSHLYGFGFVFSSLFSVGLRLEWKYYKIWRGKGCWLGEVSRFELSGMMARRVGGRQVRYVPLFLWTSGLGFACVGLGIGRVGLGIDCVGLGIECVGVEIYCVGFGIDSLWLP